MSFNEGDVVRLKSGGPDMTVDWAGDVNFSGILVPSVKCKWFEGKKLLEAEFKPELLEKVNP